MQQDVKKIVKIVGFCIFFLLIIIYAFFRSKDLIFGVKIKNVEANGAPLPTDATMTNSILDITGVAKNAVFLSLDDREISIDQMGDFNETIALLPGYNIISIKARDKFGKTDEKDYQLMYVIK
jgi:hypothetical protein